MDHQRLAAAAEETHRRLYASLPWGYRLANLFTRLAVDTTDAFGRAIMAEFLLRGVTDMPDPGPRWNAKSPKPADTLPRGYGRDFADRIYRTLLSKFRDPDLAENAMMDFLIRFTLQGGAANMQPGTSFNDAKGYVMTGVVRQGINIVHVKNKQRRNEQSLTQFDDDEGGGSIDINDPRAFEKLEELIPSWESAKVKSDLLGVISWAPQYVALAMEGYDDGEILGYKDPEKQSLLEKKFHIKPLTPTGVPIGRGWWSNANLGRKVKLKIFEVLKDHVHPD